MSPNSIRIYLTILASNGLSWQAHCCSGVVTGQPTGMRHAAVVSTHHTGPATVSILTKLLLRRLFTLTQPLSMKFKGGIGLKSGGEEGVR